jgi:hypothetical protein
MTVKYVVNAYNMIRMYKIPRSSMRFEITFIPNKVFRNSEELSKYLREHPEVLNSIKVVV